VILDRVSALLIAVCILAGCAATPEKADLVLARGPETKLDYTFQNWLNLHDKLDSDLVVLSFSGGGLRAATLAASVLDALSKRGLDKKIAVISSTSGGSVTAGYFAAKGSSGMKRFDDDFLSNDNTSDLTFRLLPSFVSGANRSMQFADYLDQRLFNGTAVHYKELIGRWSANRAPFVILNASDASSGRTFEFEQESFTTLCSDLASFRVSEAIAASAAFPFLMTPILLENYWGTEKCRPDPRWIEKDNFRADVGNRYMNLDRFVAARHVNSLRHARSHSDDPFTTPHKRIEFLHLIDGGLSDNLAARALIRTFGKETVEELVKKGVRRILLIQVNAKTEEDRSMDRSGAIPSWYQVFKTVALNPIDVTTELSSYISSDYWVRLVNYVNAPSEVERAGEKVVLRFYPVQVDFDQMDVYGETTDWKAAREQLWRLKGIETNWTLPADQVKLIKTTGNALLETHPCYKKFLREAGFGDREDGVGARVSRCEWVEVADKRYVAVGPPVPPYAAAAPRPAAAKVTLAADTLFDFDKAALRPEGKAKFDELVGKIKDIKLEIIIAIGHADHFGTEAYNQKLSERRAEAVKAYLVSKGIEPNRIYVEGKGKTRPVTKPDECEGPKSKKVLACLQPNRRVEIQIIGTK